MVLAGCGGSGAPSGDIHPGDDLFARLAAVHAGDRVLVHAGVYRTPGYVSLRWRGTAAKPIVVTGAPGEPRPVLVGRRSQNVLNLDGSHFRLARFELRGGSHGLRLGRVSDAALTGLVLHDLGDVGISCNRPGQGCRRVAIRHSVIYDTGRGGTPGEGVYLGCQDASCSFDDGTIEHNVVRDTGGSQGEGIELKPGSDGNLVRHNVICRTPWPGLTIWGPHGRGALNTVEDNLVAGSGPPGIKLFGRARLRGNRVLRSAGARACRPSAGA